MRPGPVPQGRGNPRAAARGQMILPRSGHDGPVPPWPEHLAEPTERELTRWNVLWRTPQACGWAGAAQEATVATLVRLELACDKPRIPAQLVAELRHLRGELGMTIDSLAKLGWKIEDDDAGERAATPAPVRRLKAVDLYTP